MFVPLPEDTERVRSFMIMLPEGGVQPFIPEWDYALSPSGQVVTAHSMRHALNIVSVRPGTLPPQQVTRIERSWDPLTAQAGTYAIENQHLVTRPPIAKMPAMMQSSSFNRYEVRVAGDTMWLRPVENQKGALPSAPRHMLVRAER